MRKISTCKKKIAEKKNKWKKSKIALRCLKYKNIKSRSVLYGPLHCKYFANQFNRKF